MFSLFLLLCAAAVLFGIDAERLRKLLAQVRDNIDSRKLTATILALLALAVLWWPQSPSEPTPEPDTGPLVLRGMFTGPAASEDAALLGALCLELADEISFDAQQPKPFLLTGVQLDELRKSARVLRCRGISIGDRQQLVRDKIATYLDEKVGNDGGPLTPEQRSAWVTAYREIGRACEDAAR